MDSIIYGPVPSWRLGRSLGIDLLSTQGNTCSFDCIYCQLGRTLHLLTDRREFVSMSQLAQELGKVANIEADYATFSGMGEPTLASNLGEAIQLARAMLSLPVAVLTNSSLMGREDVQKELALADTVAAKLDAPTQEVFVRINRPYIESRLDEIVEAVKTFRNSYQGKLSLQMMFVEANRDCAPQMAKIAGEIGPDEIQINTPLRPCAVSPLPPEELAAIQRAFSKLKNVVSVYKRHKPDVSPLSMDETLRRRPKL